MAKAKKKTAPAKTPASRGRGRPPTDIDWKSIGVRFLPEEKEMIASICAKTGMSQADFIRKGAVDLAKSVMASGNLTIAV